LVSELSLTGFLAKYRVLRSELALISVMLLGPMSAAREFYLRTARRSPTA